MAFNEISKKENLFEDMKPQKSNDFSQIFMHQMNMNLNYQLYKINIIQQFIFTCIRYIDLFNYESTITYMNQENPEILKIFVYFFK